MLNAIREGTKGWLANLILVLITVPFALFGLDQYLDGSGSSVPVAKVGDTPVTVQEFGNAMQNLRNRLQTEGETDLAILERPEIRRSVLDQLINDKLMYNEVKRAHFNVSDEQLSRYIAGMQEFSRDGKFSEELYYQLLSQNRMTPKTFEEMIRRDLRAQQARDGFAALTYVPDSVAGQALKLELQRREVSVAEIKSADFISQVTLEPDAVKDFYEKNKEKLLIPEQVELEFVVMSANALLPKMRVSDQEVEDYYHSNADKFQGDERRRASHILIGFGLNATPEEKQAARQKAEQVLEEVRQHDDQFAELAKKYSQDSGSAANGGDLGEFSRGTMVKQFDDAVFSMTPGAVSDLVESEFGYHIIKLTGITGESISLDSVKPQIRAELLYQKAMEKFNENAENFSNIVYEQSGSLKPVAEAFDLEVQKTPWMSRSDIAESFKSDRLVDAIFSGDVLTDGRNTEAIEVAQGTLMAARVIEHQPSKPRAFEDVEASIDELLHLEQAAKLAAEKGKATLDALRAGKEQAHLDWTIPAFVDRKDAQGLTDLVMNNAYKVNIDTLPGYIGVAEDTNRGYTLIKVSAVDNAPLEDEDRRKAARVEMQSALAAEYMSAYLESLRTKSKITVNQQLLQGDNADG